MTHTRKKNYIVPIEIADQFLTDAINVCNRVYVDMLVPGNARRQPTDKEVSWVKRHILTSKAPHLVCIERQPMFIDSEPYYDIGGCTMCYEPEYFLWVEVSILETEKLIRKYDLKERK